MYLSPSRFFLYLVPLSLSHLKLNGRLIAASTLLIFTLLAAGTQQPVNGSRELTAVQASQTEEEVRRLVEQINKLRTEAKYAEAIPLAERLIEIVEKAAGPEHAVVAQLLDGLAELYRMTQNFVRAEPLYQRALAIRQKILGPDHPDVAVSLNNFALLYIQKSDYSRAEPLLQRALSIHEKTAEVNQSDFAATLNNLAHLNQKKGEYSKAEALYIQSLAITEKTLGPNHPVVALRLNNLGELYEVNGDYERAETLYLRSLSIREKALGSQHSDVAQSLNNLAKLRSTQGDYVAAEPMLQRSLAINEKRLGPEHPEVAYPLLNLAELYKAKGDTTRAEPLLIRALAIREKTLGPDHPDVAQALNNLADLYLRKEEYARAEQLYLRSLAIVEKTLGPDHGDLGTMLNNLASLYELKSDTERAETLYKRTITIREKALGPAHPDLAYALNNLGLLHLFQKSDPQRAEPLLQRALAIFEKTFGPDHPNVSSSLHNLASLYDEKRDLATAVKLQTRSNEIVERNLALILTTGSEEQKSLYLDTLANYTHYTVSLNTRRSADSPEATRLALTTILRRKGRALDAASDQIGALRRRLKPQDRELLAQLSSARAKMATLVLTGAETSNTGGHRETVTRFKNEVERLEAEVSARSAEFRAQAQPVTIERVQGALPAGSALIEFVLFRPYSLLGKYTERIGAPRYVAYVLRREGPPAWIDLGDAVPIDRSVAELRKALSNPQSKDVKQVARTLDEQVMRPVRKLLGNTKILLLSPDGGLNLIPFGPLVDEQNRYLLENYSLTYLTSGRDVLRLQVKAESKQGPVVIANPEFDQIDGQSIPPSDAAGGRSIDFARVRFGPLKGTGEEAQALAKILPNVKILTKAEATEGALKQLAGPRILHVATHGFFLPDQPQETTAQALGIGVAAKTTSAVRRESPFVRSGLALAGANKRQGKDGEDGILTALEASGLDLWGTKLVVLSACETGVGEVKNGEGVYGLRRALVLAGAESQVISLWQVSDEATRDLMIAFYERLQAGEGRTAALTAVQLEMLRSNDQTRTGERGLSRRRTATKKDRSHPFFWASFIQSGDWRSMSAQETNAK
jgi:CHAT domain-containing protein/Tfp pilus assembly protein PilF